MYIQIIHLLCCVKDMVKTVYRILATVLGVIYILLVYRQLLYIFVHLFSAFELMRAWYAGGTPRLVNAESANNMRFSPLVWSE